MKAELRQESGHTIIFSVGQNPTVLGSRTGTWRKDGVFVALQRLSFPLARTRSGGNGSALAGQGHSQRLRRRWLRDRREERIVPRKELTVSPKGAGHRQSPGPRVATTESSKVRQRARGQLPTQCSRRR